MSLILGYANKDNAVIMSDGRARGEDFASERFNKTKKINDNIILGFVGIKESIELFLFSVLKEIGDERERYFIDDFLDIVNFYMKKEEAKREFDSTFMIIGRTAKKQMITSLVGHATNYEIEKNAVFQPRYLQTGGIIDGKIISDIYMENINMLDIPVLECMKNTIEQVSKLDNSVNSKIFYSVI